MTNATNDKCIINYHLIERWVLANCESQWIPPIYQRYTWDQLNFWSSSFMWWVLLGVQRLWVSEFCCIEIYIIFYVVDGTNKQALMYYAWELDTCPLDWSWKYIIIILWRIVITSDTSVSEINTPVLSMPSSVLSHYSGCTTAERMGVLR